MRCLLVVFASLVGTAGPALASEGGEGPEGSGISLSTIAAVVIALVHVFGHHGHRWLAVRERQARSFGAGMAVAYIFMQLVPELSLVAAEHGHRVFMLALGGFVLFYSLAKRAGAQRDRSDRKRGGFYVHLGFMSIYSWMIVYSIPDFAEQHGALSAIIVCLALTLHVMFSDHGLAEHYEDLFHLPQRFILACAALLAGFMDVLVAPDPTIVGLTVALVTGFLLFATLNEELPKPAQSDYKMFVVGAAVVVGLLELARHIA